jgi:hypothetical protein
MESFNLAANIVLASTKESDKPALQGYLTQIQNQMTKSQEKEEKGA